MKNKKIIGEGIQFIWNELRCDWETAYAQFLRKKRGGIFEAPANAFFEEMFFLKNVQGDAELPKDGPIEMANVANGPPTPGTSSMNAGQQYYGACSMDNLYDLLIDLVRDEHPYIYDKGNPQYMQRGSQNHAYSKIAVVLSTVAETEITGKSSTLIISALINNQL